MLDTVKARAAVLSAVDDGASQTMTSVVPLPAKTEGVSATESES